MKQCLNWLRYLSCLTVPALVVLSAGCSLWPHSSYDEPFSYDQLKREVEGPGRSQISAEYERSLQQKKALELEGFSPKEITSALKRSTGKGPKPDKARELFASGEQYYQQASAAEGEERRDLFDKAGKQFIAASKSWPDSSLEQDSLFLAGESYFFADRYPQSNSNFERLLKKYPNSKYIDVVEARRFAIAQHWLQLSDYHNDSLLTVNLIDRQRPWRDTRGNGLRIFDRIRIDDPTGKLADDATMAAGNAHFLKNDFFRADDFYTDMRKNFPSSEHQFNAHLLGVQSKMKAYEGPAYSGVPLDEAEKLLVQLRRQFPAEFEQNRRDLERMYAEVRFKQAERDWVTAQYYEQRKAFGAARFYYANILDEFDDTPFAEKSRERIGDLVGKPSKPEQKLQWLVNVFPNQEQQKPLVAAGGNGLLPIKR